MAEKTPKMLEAERRLGQPLEDAIAEAYRVTGSMRGAAEVLGVAEGTLYGWRLRLGVSRTVTITSPKHNPEYF